MVIGDRPNKPKQECISTNTLLPEINEKCDSPHGSKAGIVKVMCPRQAELIPPQAAFTEAKPVIPWQSSPAAASSAGDAESVAKITSVI